MRLFLAVGPMYAYNFEFSGQLATRDIRMDSDELLLTGLQLVAWVLYHRVGKTDQPTQWNLNSCHHTVPQLSPLIDTTRFDVVRFA